jgi:N-glycosylase/DNA lyase
MARTRSRNVVVKVEEVFSSSAILYQASDNTSTTGPSVPVTPSPKKVSRKRKASDPSENSTFTASDSTLPRWTRKVVESINPGQPYVDLEIPPHELRPSATLTTGQSFVWKPVVDENAESETAEAQSSALSAWGSHDATEWVGVIRIGSDLSVVMAIRETPETTLFRPLSPCPSNMDLKSLLWDYFQLKDSLGELYASWSKADRRLETIAKCIPGVRILDQDPFECLISFICSSNNNIPRITKMVNAIRREYGEPLLTEADGSPEALYSFPSVDTLLELATDEGLRQKCGLGYRSKYIMETLQTLKEKGGERYLHELRQISDPLEVQTKLCEFCGVGRKVADCTALFSLRQEDAIPVDVHVWNIARRDYDEDGQLAQIKSLTPTTYRQVGDVFRRRFPNKSGWAHSLLFVAELPSFRPVLPASVVGEMEEFQREEKLRKQETKVATKNRKP